ncbi:uncharacterized protein LOC133825583 [Humulus lupulus]|uniref:uncharacterized protein LOC133825583 n=1 Tax=Humulus lupulus TaxID=3486 RepID=UPI002B417A01|nr:uncharacterized protein LOC133825583 [Humulus lupulus]
MPLTFTLTYIWILMGVVKLFLSLHLESIVGNTHVDAKSAIIRLIINSVRKSVHSLEPQTFTPYLEVEKDRILEVGGHVQVGWINGSLNLTRVIDLLYKANMNTGSVLELFNFSHQVLNVIEVETLSSTQSPRNPHFSQM